MLPQKAIARCCSLVVPPLNHHTYKEKLSG
jgi:hypothetical protein